MVCSVGGVESGVGRLIDDKGDEARDVTLLVLATMLLEEIPENIKERGTSVTHSLTFKSFLVSMWGVVSINP